MRLLVVEVFVTGQRSLLYETQAITRLAEGLAATGRLSEAAMTRTITAVADFCQSAEAQGAREILIVATSAVREALNRGEFLGRVARAVGHAVEVVKGEEEARLALLGVLEGLPNLAGTFVLFDIGGGSTEFVLARERRVAAAASLPLGVVRLAEQYMTDGPLEASRYADMDREIRSALTTGLAAFAAGSPPDHLVGTAGTLTTLAALDQELPAYDPARVQGHVLERPRVERLLKRLGPLPAAARATLPCLEPGRADLIIPGIAICLAIMDRFGASAVSVSDSGLREGILIEHLARPAP